MIFKNLDYIVKNVLIENYEENDTRYAQYLAMAVTCARELNFIFPHNVKTVLIPYNVNKGFIDLPDDCIEWSKIGVVVGDQLVPFAINTRLAAQRKKDDCGNLEKLPPGSDSNNYVLFYNYEHQGEVGALFGYGGGRNSFGEYYEDRETNRVSFSSDLIVDEIYLEYKSNGIQPDGNALIPEPGVRALIECVHWRRQRFKPGVAAYDKRDARKEFVAAKKELRRRVSFRLDEIIDVSYYNFSQAPKL